MSFVGGILKPVPVFTDESDEDLKRALALSEEESKKPTVFDNGWCPPHILFDHFC